LSRRVGEVVENVQRAIASGLMRKRT
jgi:hypothetical protein